MAQIQAKTLHSKEHDPNQSLHWMSETFVVRAFPPLLAVRVSTSSMIFNVHYKLEAGVCAEHVGAPTAGVGGQILRQSHRAHTRGIFFFFPAVPGRPTGVTLLEAVKDYMVLGWTAPANDGGADVRGYFVDYRTVMGDVVGKWHEMNHQALATTSYKVRYSSWTNG